jgi:hypothetical protein
MSAESVFFPIIVDYLRRNRIRAVVSICEFPLRRGDGLSNREIFPLEKRPVPSADKYLLSDEIID